MAATCLFEEGRYLLMITAPRAVERGHDLRHKREVWYTFSPDGRANTVADGFGALEIFGENRLPPGEGVPRRPPLRMRS